MRQSAARELFQQGKAWVERAAKSWLGDADLTSLLVLDAGELHATVGIAVPPETFGRIRNANGSPPLAHVPPGEDAEECELQFSGSVRLDILTTKAPQGSGASSRVLEKIAERAHQVRSA